MSNKIKDVEIRRADADDIREFYPDGPPKTCYAWVAVYKGEIVCMAGVLVQRRGGYIVFSDSKEHDAPKLTAWRVIKELMQRIDALGLPTTVSCEIKNKRSQKLFRKLGFVHNTTLNGQECFSCPKR